MAVIESSFRPERRTRSRIGVHWSVLLLPGGGAKGIETVTQNLSSNGFYCFSPSPLKPGDCLLCTMKLPSYDPNREEPFLTLECSVRVMRAEVATDGLFGIACRIHDYRLINGRSLKAP